MHFSYNRKQKKKIKKEKQNKGDANKRCLAKNKKGKLLPGIELVPVFFLSCTCLIVRVGHLLRVSEKEPGGGGGRGVWQVKLDSNFILDLCAPVIDFWSNCPFALSIS
jgi:hypothetical protein